MTPDLDRAVDAFEVAMSNVGVVFGDPAPIVEALLAAGWRPPEVTGWELSGSKDDTITSYPPQPYRRIELGPLSPDTS